MGGGAEPPGAIRGQGSSESSVCTANGDTCTMSNNFVQRDLTYDASTGKLSGKFTGNQCPGSGYTQTKQDIKPECTAQTIPDPAFAQNTAPQQAPLLGRVALSLKRGVNIYGPLDAGFRDQKVCSGSDGREDCAGGTDLLVCTNHMKYQCEAEKSMTINYDMLMDRCGGHAGYHLHEDPACEYDSAASATHSTAVAVALDGHVVSFSPFFHVI